MNNSGNHCYRCRKFNVFYTKGDKRYNKSKVGWCCEKRGIVTLHENCESYKAKPLRKHIRMSVQYCLNDLLNQISAIREVIEEDSRENEQGEKVRQLQCVQNDG